MNDAELLAELRRGRGIWAASDADGRPIPNYWGICSGRHRAERVSNNQLQRLMPYLKVSVEENGMPLVYALARPPVV